MVEVLVFTIINVRIAKGASFCHVDKIKHENHVIADITDGYHKWHGARPSFINNEIINNMFIIL